MRPPTLCPKPALDSLRSRLRRISSISRSYLFGIPVLFLELARTLFVLMIPTSQLRDKGFFSQFADNFPLLLPLILFYMWKTRTWRKETNRKTFLLNFLLRKTAYSG